MGEIQELKLNKGSFQNPSVSINCFGRTCKYEKLLKVPEKNPAAIICDVY